MQHNNFYISQQLSENAAWRLDYVLSLKLYKTQTKVCTTYAAIRQKGHNREDDWLSVKVNLLQTLIAI